MKNVVITLLLFCTISISYSQHSKLEKADLLFEQYNFKKASGIYQKLLKNGVSPYHVTSRIADCYRLTNELYKSEQWYKEALKFPDVAPETTFYLGQVLLQLGKDSEAVENLKKYYEKNSSSFTRICSDYGTYLAFLKTDNQNIQIINLPINTEHSEFAPTLLSSTLVFSSNRPSSSMIKRDDIRNNKPFFDIYQASISNKTQVSEVESADPAFNSKFNDGPICFNQQENLAFITRNNIDSKSNNSQLNIVISKKRNDQWLKEVDKLSIIDKNHSMAHPFMTKDMTRLYYTSNMPGGYGGMDIYYSEFKNGFLSTPVNLGPIINTPGNEAFPFIDEKGVLYFTSNGHPGIGGYDIFYADEENEQYTAVFNPGSPINSESDDMGLYLNSDGTSGYFSSNRQGGKGDDDIYSLQILKPRQFTKINCSIKSNDQFPLKGTMVTVYDSENHAINAVESNDDGEFIIYLHNDRPFTLEFKRRLYQVKELVLSPDEMIEKEVKLNVVLDKK